MASDRVERTYRLEPLDTSGVFLGLGIVQCVLLGGGITLAVLAITAGVPVLLAAVKASGGMLAGAEFAEILVPLNILIVYDIVFIAVAFMVFDFVVEE